MYKIIAPIGFICMLLFMAGCVDSHPKPPQADASTSSVPSKTRTNQVTAASGETTQSSEENGFLTGDKFKQDSDFVIKAFDMTYDPARHALFYHIEYKLGAEATAFLQSGPHRYFFRLEAPDQWRSAFQTFQSNGVEGARLTGNSDTIYSVDIEMPLRDDLNNTTIQKIVNDRYDYGLYLYENPAFTARIVKNVYGYMKHS